MSFILYSPEHDVVRKAFVRTNTGEYVPEMVFTTGERALYKLKGLPNRRYRGIYPDPGDPDMYLAEFETIEEALDEREALKTYSGEIFEVRRYLEGQITGEAIASGGEF